jgi:hypothetical protein
MRFEAEPPALAGGFFTVGSITAMRLAVNENDEGSTHS